MKTEIDELITVNDLVEFIQTNKVETIRSFGDSGIYIDGELCDTFHVDYLDRIVSQLDDNNINHKVEFDDEFEEEWLITIYNTSR